MYINILIFNSGKAMYKNINFELLKNYGYFFLIQVEICNCIIKKNTLLYYTKLNSIYTIKDVFILN